MTNICRSCSLPCKKTDKALACSLCSQWYHAKCQGVSDAFYEVITQDSNAKDGATLQWNCKPSCHVVADSFAKVLKSIQDQMSEVRKELADTKNKIENRVNTVESRVDSINTAMDKLQEEVTEGLEKLKAEAEDRNKTENKRDTDANNTPATSHPTVTQEVLNTVNEQSRKKNVVIFGLTEKNTNLREEIKTHDLETVQDIIKHVTDVDECPKMTTTRLGKRPDNTESTSTNDQTPAKRPVLVRFENEADKSTFMKRLYRLKGSSFAHISVKQDMTREEREKEKKLREEAKNLNNSNKDQNIIYLVRGETWNRRVEKVKRRDN